MKYYYYHEFEEIEKMVYLGEMSEEEAEELAIEILESLFED